VPVGAVIIASNTGKIIAQAGNMCEEQNDPTAHAEMLVIKQACLIQNSPRLVNCDLYVTLEPCPMCAQAISLARIKRLYYGASDMKGGGVEYGARVFHASSCHHIPEVYPCISEQKCETLLKNFFRQLR
jgi:tRNA(Arg) A34 adenosine deaminase TadA